MTVLVDTSAWIEWLIGSPTADLIAPQLPDQADWIVPTLVQLELAKWLTREVGEDKAEQVIAFTQVCRVVALDTDIALSAADLGRQHRLAIADSVVLATARATGSHLLTCDAHFDGLDGVDYVQKAKA